MLMFPVRLLTTLGFALFCYSRWVRRAVMALAVSAVMVALNNAAVLEALASPGQPAHATGGSALKIFLQLLSG